MGTSQTEDSVPRERMKILVVDDDKVTRDLLKEFFERGDYHVTLVASGEEALTSVRKETFPLILSDIRMLELNGLELLAHLKRMGVRSVVILMTGFGNMEGAIEAIQQGAFDYISKPFRLNELKAVVDRAAKHWQSLGSPAEAIPVMPLAPKALIGKSPQIVEVYKTLARATMATSNVLIVGESGTGKELVARGIHDNSSRRMKAFIAVNCGALAENLLESELFGHVKGSFTGAIANKAGLFEEASGGTIFLDEIGDITPALQVKLLRVIQEGEYKPVGTNEVRKTDVRIIAATHKNLETSVREGKFREDLYYRLKVISIELPPLRDRLGDLPELIGAFIHRFSEKTQKRISHISDEAMELLMKYAWPGNVRELEHAIERAVAMTRTTILYPEDFPPEIAVLGGKLLATATTGDIPPDSLEEVERLHILKVLQEAHYNKSKAAAILGIDRKTLHRKAQRYKIDLSGKD
jgi:two-component system, NtrC family, response regulator AtoC